MVIYEKSYSTHILTMIGSLLFFEFYSAVDVYTKGFLLKKEILFCFTLIVIVCF